MQKLKFLIVEDDLFYQTYVNDLLAETGVDILNAPDGEVGLNLAIAEQPDLIITDIEIPKVQGFAFFKSLRERPETKNIPVIMMSGKVEKDLLDRHSGLNVHADGYLVKPFSGQVLIGMIRDVIGEDFGSSDRSNIPDSEEHVSTPSPDGEESVPEISRYPEDLSADQKRSDIPTVLVVDDSRYICDITRDFLEELGVRIETAFDGETGYKLASDILPDLVLLDVQMPNMNGFVVCEMLRKQEETKNIPVVLMSAVVDDESFQRHSKLRYHADAYLQKPFMKTELHEIVSRFTSLGNSAYDDLESKTGFFVPPEEENLPEERSAEAVTAIKQKFAKDLERLKSELEGSISRGSKLETELEGIKKEKDQLEAELFELRKTVEGKESGLQDKLTLATQRFEEARDESRRLAEENSILQARLEETAADDKEHEALEALKSKLEEAQQQLKLEQNENKSLVEKLQTAGSSLELETQLKDLEAKLQEASAVALELENQNKLLKEETVELREKVHSDSGIKSDSSKNEELSKEIEGLRRDLTAAIAAKQEIEDQASALIGNGERSDDVDHYKQELEKIREENRTLSNRVSEFESKALKLDDLQSQLDRERSETGELRKKLASLPDDHNAKLSALEDKLAASLKSIKSLEEEKNSLSDALKEMEIISDRKSELEKLVETLTEEKEQSQKLAASETQARMDLEGKFDSQAQEKTLLERELEEAKRQLDDHEKAVDKLAELKSRHEIEIDRRAALDEELAALKDELEKTGNKNEKIDQLEKENRELNTVLGETRQRCERLEKEAEEVASRSDGGYGDQGSIHDWDERFNQLEETLGKTVREAQTILKEQRDRESALEESVESLMKSLEEERSAYKNEREDWNARESELRDAIDDALKESRRMMGEEAARLYPIHIPRHRRPLEVVTRTSKYGIVVTTTLIALVLFAGGYFVKSKTGQKINYAPLPVESQSTDLDQKVPDGTSSRPWIATSAPEQGYEDIWRRNTVQSVSDDMMIQATLHTREELEAAIKYTADKEGWTRERIRKAMTDMAKTYNLTGSYYITVYSKNLKGGYPGYADNFEQHIALRDHSGQEVRAYFPGELEKSKFITSRVSAAGKEMNPVFLYEVGLTVAFARKGLSDKPEGLQLVLYDIGAVPMRVLTWDMSGIGSLSGYESYNKKIEDS